MFPLRDENPTEITPYATMAIIAINVVVWLTVQGMGANPPFLHSLCVYGAIPREVTGHIPAGARIDFGGYGCRVGGSGWGSVLTSMFMHGGWLHLLGNMWFLWVFGNNIEDSMGHARFVAFYLIAGILASATHILSDPSSAVPVVGASGAISGIMGAYLLLYPKVRVQTLVVLIIFIRIFRLPAWVMLGYWFLIQLGSGAASGGAQGGVAFWAHVGGFVAGLILIKPFAHRRLVEAKRAGRNLSREEVRDLGWF